MPVWVFTCCGLSCSYFPRAVSVFLLYNRCVYSGRVTLLFGHFLTTAFKELNWSCMVGPCDTLRPCLTFVPKVWISISPQPSRSCQKHAHVLRCFSNEACDLTFTHGSCPTVLRWRPDKLDMGSKRTIFNHGSFRTFVTLDNKGVLRGIFFYKIET